MSFPKNLFDVIDIAISMERSVEFLQSINIVNRTKKCPSDHDMTLDLRNKNARWQCCEKTCRVEFDILAGTWFESSTLSLDKILLFIYCLSLIHI